MNIELKKFVDQVITSGAGEILLNNIDHDGTKKGYDLEIIKEISCLASVPIVSLGGAWDLSDLKGIQAGASAVSAGSMFVYEGKFNAVMVNYPSILKLNIFLRQTINANMQAMLNGYNGWQGLHLMTEVFATFVKTL